MVINTKTIHSFYSDELDENGKYRRLGVLKNLTDEQAEVIDKLTGRSDKKGAEFTITFLVEATD